MKKIVILLIFLPFLVFSFPYRITRLIGPSAKIVDLVFELHIKLTHPEPGVSRRNLFKQIIGSTKGWRYTMAERRLIDVFNELNKKSPFGPIDLLWEINNQTIKESCGEEFNFLFEMGCSMSQQFDPAKGKKIQFRPVDNFRDPILGMLFDVVIHPDDYKDIQLLKISTVQKYLTAVTNKSSELFLQAKNQLPKQMDQRLTQIWDNIKNGLQHLSKTINIYPPTMTIGKLAKELKSKENFASWWYETIIENIADFEMLLNILVSKKKHIILYAGGAHCNRLIKLLENNFNFKVVFDLGISTDVVNNIFMPREIFPNLSSKAINLLTKRAIKQDKQLIQLIQDRSANLFIKAMDITDERTFIQLLKQIVKDAKKSFANLFDVEYKGKTLLHKAIENAWDTAANFLLEQPDISLDIKDEQGNTPLHRAIVKNQVEIVEQLLKKGASRHTQNEQGLNALDLATKNQRLEITKQLLKQGSRVNEIGPDGKTALHHAAAGQRADIVSLLIEAGANTTIKDNQGKKPIYYAKDKEIQKAMKEGLIKKLRKKKKS